MKDWLSQFILSFGAEGDSSSYTYRDQKDVVRDFKQNNPGWSNPEQNSNIRNNEMEEESTEIGKDEETGEAYEVKVKSLNKKINKDKEDEWRQRELTITFTSLDEKDKVIHSHIDYLCGGRYAGLKNLSTSELAHYFSKECGKVFKYADASIANYSEIIDPRQALRLAKSISERQIISHVDYEKLCSKLNKKMIGQFDNLLAEAKIKIAYPIIGMKKEAVIEEPKENYYLNYIKDFKEYKTANIHALRIRVSSILNQMSEQDKKDLMNEIGQDPVLKTIF